MTTAVRIDPARNRRVALIAFGGALAMLGLGYASVPLYRLFCQVTGFGGTTQRVGEAQAAEIKPIAGETLPSKRTEIIRPTEPGAASNTARWVVPPKPVTWQNKR